MVSKCQSLRREITIVNELGLHARSAAKLAKTASEARGAVWIEAGSEKVDAKEILDILTLGATRGDTLHIGIETADDLTVLETLVELVAGGFGE
jgi:phosphocarrier protein